MKKLTYKEGLALAKQSLKNTFQGGELLYEYLIQEKNIKQIQGA